MDVLNIVLNAISERKGEAIDVYDVRSHTPFLDTMVVASSSNLRQNNAIAANIRDRLKEAGYTGEIREEGMKESKWLLIDLKEIVVHLFVGEERNAYGLDRLYADVLAERYDV